MDHRAQILERRKNELDSAIQGEMKRPLPDTMTLQRLKKEKLALKDQL